MRASQQQHAAGGARLWGSATAAALLGLLASAGVGAGLRGGVCPQQQAAAGAQPSALVGPEGLWQQTKAAAAAMRSGGGGGWPVVSLPSWAGGEQLGPGAQGVLVSCVAVLACTLGCDVVRLAARGAGGEGAAAATGGKGGGAGGGGAREDGQGAEWRAALRVATLSCVCLELAAMASINWALAYAVAALLVPVVVVGGWGRGARPVARAARSVVLLLTSPAAVTAVLLALAVVDAGGGWWDEGGGLEALRGAGLEELLAGLRTLVCGTCTTTYAMFWAALVPVWAVECAVGGR